MIRNFSITLIFVLMIFSCKTTPVEIAEDLSPNELFQQAQEYFSEKEDYSTALIYYNTFIERYPDDIQRIVEAEYEIANIYYKIDDYITAEKLFREILAKYSGESAQLLPKWPGVLSAKLLGIIEDSKLDDTAEDKADL